VFIKRVALSHFKSFGGTTEVPLLNGFTVISGPNGSGKSNILDALLFALGLSSSKGMRAERLPDLVNQAVAGRSKVSEAIVTVTFALDDDDVARMIEAEEEDNRALPDLDDETELENEAETVTVELGDEDAAILAEVGIELPPTALENGAGNGAGNNGQNGGQNGSRNGGQKSSGKGGKHTNNSKDSGLILDPIQLAAVKEWTVTRKLRVTQQGTYTSNYYINDMPCTLADLHEQMQKFHVYPEGYNVVLQGDVTSIISMNPRERREIIDELAGVAAFDRKIHQAKDKLDAVKEREEKFRIVEQELIAQRDRLAQDKIKAEKYQKLRTELQNKSQWEGVLLLRDQDRQVKKITDQIAAGEKTAAELATQLTELATTIQAATTELEQLNTRVKALGEDEQLTLQATLATREAELRQIQRQEQELIGSSEQAAKQIERMQVEIQTQIQELEALAQQRQRLEAEELITLKRSRDTAQQDLETVRENATAIAANADAWMQQQTALRRQIEEILRSVEPQRTEQARVQERVEQLRSKIQEQTDALANWTQDNTDKQTRYTNIVGMLSDSQRRIEETQAALLEAEQEMQVQQSTLERLVQEQRDKQRQLDKLEAQVQAIQDTQGGTGTLKILDQFRVTGIKGLVAQLGKVDPQYQLALEIAAGARLAYIVVDDDGVAARSIDLLKRQRGGRATFLPLNKIRAPQVIELPKWDRPKGFIDYAANLIECDEQYQQVFAYVFGNTVVFSDIDAARRKMGDYRIVTLEGELLESSGAMTGGSLRRDNTLHFGRVEPAESREATELKERLQEIDRILAQCQKAIAQAAQVVKERSQASIEARQQHREIQLQAEQLQNQMAGLVSQEGQLRSHLTQNSSELTTAQTRLQTLEQTLPQQEAQLQQHRQQLLELEQSQTHSEWQQLQAAIRQREEVLAQAQLALQAGEQRLKDLDTQQQRIQEKMEQLNQRIQEYRAQQTEQINQRNSLTVQQTALTEQIDQTKVAIAQLEQTLAAEKAERDRAERQLREHQTQQQQVDWQRQKLMETQQARRDELQALHEQLDQKRAELPDPLPEVPEDLGLEQLQNELRSLAKRLQAMEPVNMLALEEHERTQARLDELSQKLGTLDEERNELLLRIENFTTLRQRAFREAFDAVNKNFQAIFAELSDGDGHLQLDNSDDPFAGGLNLVAHPKGKPVRRLASMSGGEKSLTALSFIFALQRYRPSPFYAFDEVDMFLDGANVERLSKMIRHQTQHAQFIVVSLRRPMIEAAQRTIGVTQARGAYTQVLGLSLQEAGAN
jgi:chromosome segregation protein